MKTNDPPSQWVQLAPVLAQHNVPFFDTTRQCQSVTANGPRFLIAANDDYATPPNRTA